MEPRVLVVDDEPDIALSVAALLRAHFPDVEFDTALDAQAAQACLADHPAGFAVVLTDERMPGMRGTELLGWIKKTFPETRGLLMSALNDPGRDMPSTVDGFFRKPLEMPRLLQSVREGLVEAQRRNRLKAQGQA